MNGGFLIYKHDIVLIARLNEKNGEMSQVRKIELDLLPGDEFGDNVSGLGRADEPGGGEDQRQGEVAVWPRLWVETRVSLFRDRLRES